MCSGFGTLRQYFIEVHNIRGRYAIYLVVSLAVPFKQRSSEHVVPRGLREDVPELARPCLTTTYFLWNNKYYKQTEEAAMGLPLSPAVGNIIMEKYEEERK